MTNAERAEAWIKAEGGQLYKGELESLAALLNEIEREARVVGFYEDEYPVYSEEWTHELQSPVTAEELNRLVARLKQAKAVLRDIVEDSRDDGPINRGLNSIQAAETFLAQDR